jgi:hypothetical protein
MANPPSPAATYPAMGTRAGYSDSNVLATAKSSVASSPSWANSANYVGDVVSFQAPMPFFMFAPAIVP